MKTAFIYFSLFVLILIACNSKKNTSETNLATLPDSIKKTLLSEKTAETDFSFYFKANGNEPFWGLAISNDKIVFKSLSEGVDSFETPHVEPILAQDANVKLYKIANETMKMDITIAQQNCINSMSGDSADYTVEINISKGTNNYQFNGCGKYITDYRLHDIWVLESIKNYKVSLSDFGKELPMMEINTSSNKFMGYAGCNRMNGTIFSENKLLRFSKINTTRMMCAPDNKENEFLLALEAATNYKIENNRLWLSNSNGMQVVFKKVD